MRNEESELEAAKIRIKNLENENHRLCSENAKIESDNAKLKWLPTDLIDLQERIKELEAALRGLVADVKRKPNYTRYATHIKIAEQALRSCLPSPTPAPDTETIKLPENE